jgi:hypothetical protein
MAEFFVLQWIRHSPVIYNREGNQITKQETFKYNSGLIAR